MLSVIQMHLSPPPTLNGVTPVTNPLFTTVASTLECPIQGVKVLVEKGLLVFFRAVPGPAPPAAEDPGTGSRKRQKFNRCAAPKGFVVIVSTGIPLVKYATLSGAHIIPYSAKD